MYTKIKQIIKNSIIIFPLIFFSCKKTHYEKRKDEAIWMYYETNFKINRIGCPYLGRCLDTNICFIDGVKVSSKYIGDTLELAIFSIIKNDSTCLPLNSFGSSVIIFGFFPNIDTVAYREEDHVHIDKRELEQDSTFEKIKYLGYNTRAKQKIEFKEFIIKNKSKLNKWLREEAIKRGYINKD